MLVSAAGSGTSRMPWVSVAAALVVPVVVAGVAHVVDPEEARMAKVDALAGDVDALRDALAQRTGSVGSCGSEEAARSSIAEVSTAWHEAPCWSGLPVTPSGEHAFWIVGGGHDFAVHGIADLDADGEQIEFVATGGHAAEAWTAPGVR